MIIIEIWIREPAISHLDVLCLVVLRYIFFNFVFLYFIYLYYVHVCTHMYRGACVETR